jgi:hypothetical protein
MRTRWGVRSRHTRPPRPCWGSARTIAARVPDRQAAELVITEVEALYMNGPAGGGGVRSGQRPTIRTYSAYLERSRVAPRCTMFKV